MEAVVVRLAPQAAGDHRGVEAQPFGRGADLGGQFQVAHLPVPRVRRDQRVQREAVRLGLDRSGFHPVDVHIEDRRLLH